MSNHATKRGRGRPRNPLLDELQNELAVSRRRASSVLKEMKSSKATTSENSTPGLSPLAAARLEKIQKEIQFLETRIRTAELEARAAERELLYVAEAIELCSAAVSPLVERLKTHGKTMAPRLHGQSQRDIEKALTAEADELIAIGRASIQRFQSKVGRKI